MDTKAKRKYKKHKKRSGKPEQYKSLNISKLFGIEKLYLSPLTQQILDCRVGIHITPQQPWIFIPKEKILENIELHNNSSELLPIKDQIDNYPDDKILIGSYGHEQNAPEVFMVCTSIDTVQITLEALQAQEDAIHKRITDSLALTCGTWISLGSETEVEDNMIRFIRKPFQVHLTSETASFFVRSKFTFRFVADSPDGYVELLSSRQTFRNVLRRRVHAYVQRVAQKVNATAQTLADPVVNNATTCGYLMKPKKMAQGALEKFYANIDDKLVLDLLQTNYYMDLCRNDYKFPTAFHIQLFKFPLCILSFQDIFTCRGKRVSSVSWSAMKSGVIAAAYVNREFTMIVEEERLPKTSDTVFEDHLVLVWSYTDIIKPFLYLHCCREVTVVSFCSHNGNVVVGGCDNGQIVVWDISGRMERAGQTKMLTKGQQENRIVLQHYMTWMKNPPEVQHVYPVIISQIEQSHLCPISYIEWLPPDQFITKNGIYEKCKGNNTSLQFLSCNTENGCIDIWDIRIREDPTKKTTKKRLVRLNKIPDALIKYVSPFKALQKGFIPVFRLLVSNPENRKPLSISKLLERQGKLIYRALNPDTEADLYKRTDFEHVPALGQSNDISEQHFICTTTFGEVRSIQWDGFDYDPGCVVNSYAAEVGDIKIYHDGPISVCIENPVIKNIFLTIGGRVFAIWNATNLNVPIFWRKSPHRYVTGTWLTTHPFQIGLARYDSFKEIWDLMEDSKNALKTIKGNGRSTVGIFNDFGRKHAKKGTFSETNIAGEIKIYSIAHSLRDFKDDELKQVVTYLNKLECTRQQVVEWTDTIKKKFSPMEIIAEEETAEEKVLHARVSMKEEDSKQRRKTALQVKVNAWQAKEEAFMREVLLANKHLKIDQISLNSDLLRQAEELRKKHTVKIAEQLKNKDKNLDNWRALLIPERQFIKKEKITVTFSKDMCQYIKKSYIQSYNDIEEATVDYIEGHSYHYFYNWAEFHERARITWRQRTRHRKSVAFV